MDTKPLDKIKIEINGAELEATPGEMIIHAAERAGVLIPRFCYHKKLSIAANCRMCLVDVEKAPKPLPACATPVAEGMIVRTQSEGALEAQKSVMEFLLINHPLDCPICDQGGECELQDVALGFGKDVSRYSEGKRAVGDKDIGALVATDMTRCIHCTRCVRFGDEIAGVRELGATGRGEHMEIGTYIQHHLKSEISGNVIDLCPVGALTSKPFRFKARAWELEQLPTVAPHDCVGSNVYAHCRNEEVMRVVPCENEAINETWISDRDRFSYEGLYSNDRLMTPRIKEKGQWIDVDWKTALEFAASGLKKVIDVSGASELGGLISPNATTEECYLFQKLIRALGSHHIDHRLRQTDFSDQLRASAYPGLNTSIEALEAQKTILLIGSDLQREQPMLSHRVRKAGLAGASIFTINPIDFEFAFEPADKLIIKPSDLVNALAGIAKALLSDGGNDALSQCLSDITPSDVHRKIASQLKADGDAILMLGALALNHPHASLLKGLAQVIATMTGCTVSYLTEGANAAGAWLAGALPHRTVAGLGVTKPGADAAALFQQPLKAYCLLNIEPELDCANPQAAIAALEAAEFVVSLSPFVGDAEKYADVMLPIAPFSETSGTYVNTEGKWQSFKGVCSPRGEARPAWKVLRVLGNIFNIDGFEYTSSQEIHDELKPLIDSMSSQMQQTWEVPANLPDVNLGLERVTPWPIYRGDNVLRRAGSLQASREDDRAVVRIPASLAEQLQLKDAEQVKVTQGSASAVLPLVIDDAMPGNCVYVPGGFSETAGLGASFGELTLERS